MTNTSLYVTRTTVIASIVQKKYNILKLLMFSGEVRSAVLRGS